MADGGAYWSGLAARGYAPNWFGLCADEITRRVTGQEDVPISRFLMRDALGRPARHLLEIGCLTGKKTVSFLDSGDALKVSGCDYAEGALEQGRALYGERINLFWNDLNRPDLPQAEYDLILANGVLHHIEHLEACAEALRAALEPGGVLLASEFTGPVRYRYSQRELDTINKAVAKLPAELRDPFDPAVMAPKLAADPSERIRSRDIEAVLRATFGSSNVEARPYGGNVLMRAMGRKFFAGLDLTLESHRDAVEMLVDLDAQAMDEAPSHHCYFVCRA